MKPSSLHKVLWIKWYDSSTQSGWKKIDGIIINPLECESVGFLVQETPKAITLAISAADPNICDLPCHSTITIPKGCILKKKILRR